MNHILQFIKHKTWLFFKRWRVKGYRTRYINHDVTIISMNCTGGILYHDLGLKFMSPTINLYMKAEDFIKFCENMSYYLTIDKMLPCMDSTIVGNRKYPVVWLGDILLYLVHYHSVDDAQQKWNSRKRRINWDKIVVFNNDREGMTSELKDRFELLPYKKVMFTHKPDNIHKSCHYIPGYENDGCVGIITDADGWLGKRPIDRFDRVDFLNKV